jgi:hypothetical protein
VLQKAGPISRNQALLVIGSISMLLAGACHSMVTADGARSQVGTDSQPAEIVTLTTLASQAFLFVDGADTQEITVEVPNSTRTEPTSQWAVRTGISPLVGPGHSPLELHRIQRSPSSIIQSFQRLYAGATVNVITIVPTGSTVTWFVFGETG